MARSCAFAEFIDSRIIAIRVAGSSICVARIAVTEATELPESTSSLGRIDTGAMAFHGLSGSPLSDSRYLRNHPAHLPRTASLRQEQRPCGNGCVSQHRYRWSHYDSKQHTPTNYQTV